MISPYEEAIKHQEKNLEDLRNLSHRLQELPRNLHEYGLQKLNSVCFIPARLYHTNEILVHIGNDYFVERSSFQAKEIADRRIKVQEKMLKDFKNQANSKQKKQKKEVLDIREPIQAEVAETKAETKVVSSEITTTNPPSILKTSQTKTPSTQSNKEQEVQKQNDPKVEDQSPADASVKRPISNLQSILEMVEAGNYKIEDYTEDQEENDKYSDEEEKNIPEIISKTTKQTADVAQDIQKKSSEVKQEKPQKQVMFSPDVLKLSPEEMLKERDFQTKERLRQMNERAVQLGNTEEEIQNQQAQPMENIMDKVKPSEKKEVAVEEEQQEKKVSKFKQRMMDQGKK